MVIQKEMHPGNPLSVQLNSTHVIWQTSSKTKVQCLFCASVYLHAFIAFLNKTFIVCVSMLLNVVLFSEHISHIRNVRSI